MLRKSITTIQREGQAPRPTKSESDSANVKPYKHTNAHPTKSGARVWRAFAEIAGRVWRQDGGADELSVTGNFKESVGTAMKGTICF